MVKAITMKLDDIAKIERGRFSPRPRNDPRYYGGDIPFVQTGDVSRAGTYIQEYSQTLNEEGLAVSKLFPKGTILMTIAANVGDVSILGFDSACPDSLVAFTPKKEINNKWLFHVLRTMKKKFDSISTQNAQKNLSLGKIKSVNVQFPDYECQVNISSTLDAWDMAIEKTEALIDAKERQFEWLRSNIIGKVQNATTHKFGDFLKESKITDTIKNPKKRLTVRLHLKGVDVREYRGTEKEGATQYFVRKAGQLIYGKQNIFRGSIGIIPLALDGYSSSQDIPAFDIAESVNADWLFWYMSRPYFYERLEHFAAGSGSKRLHPKELFKMHVDAPPIDKQKAIAHTLNTAQQEITLLKKLADGYRTQKRGLMQKLLSGE